MNETELLQSFRPWLRTVAAGFPETQPSRVEELAQEGWIAVWRAISQNKDGRPLEPFLKQCAINRMRDVFRQWTAANRNVYMTHSVDMTPGEINLWDVLQTNLGDIEEAYHHGEIMQAVSRLPKAQRQYVIRKFWHCWDPTALDLYFTNHRKVWREAKTTLSKELAHLGA
jgi:DNA-directed RNA polymerase specialized sigma24 family protein